VRIPIGPQFKVSALVSYQFALVYNSHLWHFDNFDQPEPHYEAAPVKRFNAGLGWTLSLGELFSPTDISKYGSGWRYESPDGSDHGFTLTEPGYTLDGSHLRMRTSSDTERRIHRPGGTIQVYCKL